MGRRRRKHFGADAIRRLTDLSRKRGTALAGFANGPSAGLLAVSEVVTNAVLHAHTEVKIWTAVYDDLVCIEVTAGNPAPPSIRHYNAEASTGRGLGLVAVLSVKCGIRSQGPEGKVIWFCMGDPGEAAMSAERAVDEFAPWTGWATQVVRPDSASAIVLSSAENFASSCPASA